jgi:hypothetical protein
MTFWFVSIAIGAAILWVALAIAISRTPTDLEKFNARYEQDRRFK